MSTAHPKHTRRIAFLLLTLTLPLCGQDGTANDPPVADTRANGREGVLWQKRNAHRMVGRGGRTIVGKAVGVAGSFNIKDKRQPRLGRFFHQLD